MSVKTEVVIPSRLPVRYAIGIDPGVKTGIAVWDKKERKFIEMYTTDIMTAWSKIQTYKGDSVVVVEDPHLRTWFGKSSVEKYQGAGSIKRDFKIWKSLLDTTEWPYRTIAPKEVQHIGNHAYFKALTRCDMPRSSQHARDAAMMVYGV
jgi:hypothetical protein